MAADHRARLWLGRSAVVQDHPRLFALVGVSSVFLVAVVGLFYAVVVGTEFLAGFAVGSLGVGIAAALFWIVDINSGRHNDRFGTYGEEATADLFETRRMRRAGWTIIHNMPFRGIGDVDHVAVGPAGIVVIESKWANAPWSVRAGVVVASGADPTLQAWRAADKIQRFLATQDINVQPVPVLVQWGPGGLPDGWSDQWVDRVLVVRHPRSADWLAYVADAGSAVDLATRASVVDALSHQLSRSGAKATSLVRKG